MNWENLFLKELPWLRDLVRSGWGLGVGMEETIIIFLLGENN